MVFAALGLVEQIDYLFPVAAVEMALADLPFRMSLVLTSVARTAAALGTAVEL